MKKNLPADTDIFFRARRVADEIAGKSEPQCFGVYVRRNSHAGRLVRDLSSEDNAEQMYRIASECNPEEGRRVLQKKLALAHKVKLRRRAVIWSDACVAAVIVAGLGAGRVFSPPPAALALEQIAPGSNKAVLELADGSRIFIDEDFSGEVSGQEDISVNVQDGELSYSVDDVELPPVYNTISIPRGGEHRVTLADGTRVWLNSGSSLRYLIPFAEDERRVTLSGEAYFEVTFDSGRPFIVESGGQRLTVLGTKFNIKAYPEENVIASTLIEGSVRVSSGNGTDSLVLVPGTQSLFDSATGRIDSQRVDAAAIISWKDGVINIEQNTLEEVLTKLSRWYDVDFKIVEEDMADFRFRGDIPKHSSLTSVVSMLEKAAPVRFEVKKEVINVKKR